MGAPSAKGLMLFVLHAGGAALSLLAETGGAGQGEVELILPALEVVGSRLEGLDAALFSRVVFDLDAPGRSGAASWGDWLQRLPYNSGGVAGFAANPTSRAPARQGLNFRGLGGGATLVLVNGRRIAPMGLADGSSLTYDVGALPAVAVERAAVLLDGSAAIHGADAVGGVVDLRTRRDFTGGGARVAYRQLEDTDLGRREAALYQGHAEGSVSFLFALDHVRANEVRLGDLSASRTEDLRPRGGLDLRSDFAFPAFVQLPADPALPTALAGRLVGIGTVDTHGRLRLGGATTSPRAEDFVVVPGNVDASGGPRSGDSRAAFDRAPYTSYLPGETSTGAWLSGRARVRESLELFSELSFRRRELRGAIHPLTVNLRGEGAGGVGDGPGGGVVLPAASPYNPFGVDLDNLRFSLPGLGPRERIFLNDIPRVVVGAEGGAPPDVRWEGALLWTRNRVREEQRNVITDAGLQDGLSGRAGGFLNPFGPSDPGVLEALRATLRSRQEFTLTMADLRVSRLVAPWDEGPEVSLGGGVEWREERFVAAPDALAEARGFVGWSVLPAMEAVRDTRSAHVESGLGPWRGWSGHAALRLEQNDDYGTAWTPHAGVAWEILPGLRLRARRAELYRPPELVIAYGDRVEYGTNVTRDPERPDLGSHGIRYSEGGDPSLAPERTTSWRFGVLWETKGRVRSTWSADYWDYRQRDLIARIGAQEILDREEASPGVFTSRIIRAPAAPDGTPGEILRIDDSFINIDRARSHGWDFGCRLEWDDTAAGIWFVSGLATWLRSASFEDRTGGSRELAGAPGRPKLRGEFALGREWARWDAAATWSWIGRQTGNGFATGGDNRRPGHLTTGASVGWRPAEGMRIGFLVTNLFDVDPPTDYGNPRGFDGGLYDASGRGYAITLDWSW